MELAFKTPIYILRPELDEGFLDELRKDIYKIRANEPSLKVSNINAWHSQQDLFIRKEESIKKLCSILMKETTRALCSISKTFDPNKFDGHFGGWININPKGGSNASHHHQPNDWSGVFYVEQPEISEGASGMIEFINPCQQSSELARKGFSDAGFEPFYRIRPKVGEIVIFPSYLVHSVYPNESDSDRISVAYNIKLTMK